MNNSSHLLINIKQLVGILPENTLRLGGEEMNQISTLENAFLEIENGLIKNFGLMKNLKVQNHPNIFNASEKIVIPSWNDSHSHLVFAGTREKEFIDRINVNPIHQLNWMI